MKAHLSKTSAVQKNIKDDRWMPVGVWWPDNGVSTHVSYRNEYSEVWKCLQHTVNAVWVMSMNAASLNANFSNLILDLLPTGHPSIVIVSERCGIPVRTLQRQLHNAGITYRELVDKVRFDTACRLLRQPQNNIKDVATAVGYQNASNFNRAFQRWAGVSPSEYQRQQARSKKL